MWGENLRKRDTGEDEWSRRLHKSSLSWDRHFWGPHEGPSSQQLLCSCLMHLSPPSLPLSFSLPHSLPFLLFFYFTIKPSSCSSIQSHHLRLNLKTRPHSLTQYSSSNEMRKKERKKETALTRKALNKGYPFIIFLDNSKALQQPQRREKRGRGRWRRPLCPFFSVVYSSPSFLHCYFLVFSSPKV